MRGYRQQPDRPQRREWPYAVACVLIAMAIAYGFLQALSGSG